MERSGALQGFQAIVALVEQILSGVGVSEAHQEVLFEHIRTLHHSNQDLNFRLQHPRFLSPMPVDSRPPTIEAPEVGLRADLGAALHLLMRNRVNKKKAAADIETATGAPAASVIQWRRDGLTGPDQRIRGQFRTILELMAKHFPDDPARAAKELINSRSKNAGVS